MLLSKNLLSYDRSSFDLLSRNGLKHDLLAGPVYETGILTFYDGSVDDTNNFGTSASEGQGFQVQANCMCTGFAIKGSKDSLSSGTTFTVEIRSGTISGALVKSETFNTSLMPAYTATPSFIDFNWSSPASLSAGIQYFLKIICNNGQTASELRWSTDTTSPSYSYGSRWGGTTETPAIDHNFKIYGF